MLELLWAPLLGCLSQLFEEYSDPQLSSLCLHGLACAASLSALLGLSGPRDVYVGALAGLTGLHSPGSLRPRGAAALRALLRVAADVGDHLGER